MDSIDRANDDEGPPVDSMAAYLRQIEIWAGRYDQEATAMSPEEFEALYDDAFFEAMELEKTSLAQVGQEKMKGRIMEYKVFCLPEGFQVAGRLEARLNKLAAQGWRVVRVAAKLVIMYRTGRVMEWPVSTVMKNATLVIKLTGLRQFRVRLWLAERCMKLAAKIMGCGLEFQEPDLGEVANKEGEG